MAPARHHSSNRRREVTGRNSTSSATSNSLSLDPPNSLSQNRGPMKRHSLWHYFNFDEEQKRSSCKHCMYTVAGNYTTTLKTHLRNHHRELFNEMEKKEEDRVKHLPSKRNATGNTLMDEVKKGKLTTSQMNAIQQHLAPMPMPNPFGVVAHSIAGPDITAAFQNSTNPDFLASLRPGPGFPHFLGGLRGGVGPIPSPLQVPNALVQPDEGLLSMLHGFLHQKLKQEAIDEQDMPKLDLEEQPSTSEPPQLQSSSPHPSPRHSPYHLTNEPSPANHCLNGNFDVRHLHEMATKDDEEEEEDDFESFEIPDITACLKQFYKKMVDLSKENKELKQKVGVLEKRVKTLEGQRSLGPSGCSNLLNGHGCIEPTSEFDVEVSNGVAHQRHGASK